MDISWKYQYQSNILNIPDSLFVLIKLTKAYIYNVHKLRENHIQIQRKHNWSSNMSIHLNVLIIYMYLLYFIIIICKNYSPYNTVANIKV